MAKRMGTIGTFFLKIEMLNKVLQKSLGVSDNLITRFHRTMSRKFVQFADFWGTKGMAIGAILGGMMAPGVAATIRYEQEMANVNSILDVSMGTMKKMSDLAIDVGKTTVYSATLAGKAQYYLASAGFSVQQTMAALPGTVRLAIATQFDLATTTKLVITTLRAFQLSASQSSRIANVFAASIASSQLRIEMLTSAYAYMAPVAAMIDMSVEELAALFAKLADAGFSASLMATGLRGTIDRLLRPTTFFQKVLKRAGLTIEDVNPKIQGMTKVIDTLSKAQMTAGEIFGIFGRRAAPVMMRFMKIGAKVIEDYEVKITGTNKAWAMANIQMNTVSGQLRILKNTFQALFISLGEGIKGPLKGLVFVLRHIVGLLESAARVTPFLSAGFLTLGGTAAGILILGGAISVVWKHLKGLETAFKWLKMSLRWGPFLIRSPIKLLLILASALFGLGVALYYVFKKWKDHLKAAQEYSKEIKTHRKETSELIKEYNNLARVQGKGGEQAKRQREILIRLVDLYPTLTKEILEMGGASRFTAEMVERLNNAQIAKEYFAKIKERIAIEEEVIRDKHKLHKATFQVLRLQQSVIHSERIFSSKLRWGYISQKKYNEEMNRSAKVIMKADAEVWKTKATLEMRIARLKGLKKLEEAYLFTLKRRGVLEERERRLKGFVTGEIVYPRGFAEEVYRKAMEARGFGGPPPKIGEAISLEVNIENFNNYGPEDMEDLAVGLGEAVERRRF